MRKKILGATFMVAVMAVAGYNVYMSQTKNRMSKLALANVEALANSENANGSSGNETTWQIVKKTKTVKTYTTTDKGWKWNFKIAKWIFEGSVSDSSPSNYEETTETIEYNCCILKGESKECIYEEC